MRTAVRRQLQPPVWLRQSVALSDARWAVWPALRAMAAAGAIAIAGVASHNLSAVALIFFGAACAVAYVASGSHRTRLVALVAQGSGAAVGLGVGAIGTTSTAGKVIVAAAVGLASGTLGAIARWVTPFALMAVIGVAYEQFGGVPLPWYEQAGWYLLGTTLVSTAAILPLPGSRRESERSVPSEVAIVASKGPVLLAGIRLAWCMGLATALTCVLHQSSHSYWLPLTVAVVVRPEYASIFDRTVNRVIGTIGGAVLAAMALLVLPSGGVVALAATLSIGWAVLSAPKLYGLSVIGITGSALLSASIGSDDPVYPALRMLDTLAGCAIAIVFGYLLWPARQQTAVLIPPAG